MKFFSLIVTLCSFLLTLGATRAAPLQEQVEKETAKREQMLAPLQEAFAMSKRLVSDGQSAQGCELLEKAYSALPETLRETPLALDVKKTLAKLQAVLAEAAAEKNHWPEARRRALASLQYDPQNELALAQLQQADEVLRRGTAGGEEVNPALTTTFFDRLSSVRTGLEEAQALRETGQLQKAEERYEDVLQADPFNQVATEGIKKIYQERGLVAEKARDLSNLERRREVREAWNNIYPKNSSAAGGIVVSGALTASPSYALEQKMQKTVIPQVDFSGADLETIRRALISLSRTYDSDAGKGGVNFVVSTDVESPQPVTLKLRQTTLAEVVRYIAQIAGVKARITDIGVTFGPLVEKRPELNSQNFTVSPSFFKGADDKDQGVTGGALRGAAPAGGAGAADVLAGQNEQKKLMALGVQFPAGAYAVYNQKTSQLKVVNNQEMLDMIGQLISAAEEQTLLIQVGLRLVEINQLDLDSITMNSTLGGLPILSPVPVGLSTITGSGTTTKTNGSGVGGGTPAASTQRGVNAQLNQIQGVGLLPNNTLQSFLQQGVLAGTNQTTSYALNTMDLGGTILNGMQFRTMITAVSQKNSANVLANPSIILKRGQKGVIEVTQEFKYVKEYSDPQSSIRTINTGGTGGATNSVNVSANQSVPGPETVIGSFPSQISDAVPIGVKMGVKPDVTGDNSRVLLELEPSFVDFEGFINYGTQINSAYTLSYFNTAVTIMTNTINQPVFIRRDLTLPAVEVSDGYTLLLGGLLREDIQKIDEKVPLIGDIPIFGRAFQGKTEQAIKKNTLIFVTPRILDVSGQPLNPTAGSPTTTTASTSGPP
jgi:general secretion pathway protein D